MNDAKREEINSAARHLASLTDIDDMRGVIQGISYHYGAISRASEATGLKLGVFRYNANGPYLERQREAIEAAADDCAAETASQIVAIIGGRND